MTEILITSSVLIAVIVLVRAVLRDHIRPGLQYALWGLVLLRLLVPVSWFESPVSVADAAEPIVRQVQQYSAENTRTVTFPVTMGEIPETGAPNEAVARAYIAPLDVARWIWLGGTVVLAAWFLFVNVRLARKLSRERKIYSRTHAIPVYVTKTLPSPCLYLGDIYLTEEAAADPARAEYIIAHELTHRRHLDGLWSALRVVCLAVWWFNPLVWLAAVLSRRDCELFCDAATVKRLGEAHRFDYGRTLLDMTAVNIRPGDLICSATTMSGSGKSLKERIVRIAQNRKTSVLLGVVVILIAAIAVGCTFSGGETKMLFEADPEISDPYATPEPEPVEEIIAETTDQFYGLPGVKSLPDESPIPILETADFGILGVFGTGYNGPWYDSHRLTEYLAGCTMTPIYYSEDYINLHTNDAKIQITIDSLNIYLGVPSVSIPHYAVILGPDEYTLCVLNDGEQIYTDIKKLLPQLKNPSAPIPGTPSYQIASSSTIPAETLDYSVAVPSQTPKSLPAEQTPTPVAVESVPTTSVVTEETEPSEPASTPAPEARDPSIIPIADTPENLWGENWRDGLTEEQIARLESE